MRPPARWPPWAAERPHHSTFPTRLWRARTGRTAKPPWTSAGPLHRRPHRPRSSSPPHLATANPPWQTQPLYSLKDRLNEGLSPSGNCQLERSQGSLLAAEWGLRRADPETGLFLLSDRIASELGAVLASSQLGARTSGAPAAVVAVYCSPYSNILNFYVNDSADIFPGL